MGEPAAEAATSERDVLLATKLNVPGLRPDLVPRPRLAQRLDEGRGRGLVLVCAPAGYGKTVLLAEWARRGRHLVAWLSLDAGDNDPARFWRHLVAALGRVRPGIGERLAPLLGPPAPPSFEPVVTALINEVAGQPDADEGLLLILDDYHVIGSQLVHEPLGFLLEHRPPELQLALTSRSDPPLALARLRARGQLTEVRAAELRFTPGEAAALLQQVAAVPDQARPEAPLPDAAVAALTARTEGWAAGLQLAALSLRGQDDVGGFVAAFTGSHRYVLDYLAEEVLEQQGEPVREFLLQTSVLERLSGELCDAVTGRPGSQALLEQAERAGLFVVPLDEVRGWWRYHHLFADLLRARLQAEQPGRVPGLHRSAAAWYAQRGLADDAIRHAVAAGEMTWAARLIEQHYDELFYLHGEAATVQRWLSALPRELVRSRPRLLLTQAFLALISGRLEAVEPLLDAAQQAYAGAAEEPFEPTFGRARSLLVNVPALIAIHRGFLAQLRGDADATVAFASQAMAEADEGEWRLSSTARGFLAVGEWLRGQLAEAERTFMSSVAEWRAAGLPTLTAWVLYLLGQVQRAQGGLDAAARWTQENGLNEDDEPDYAREPGHLVLARVLLAQARPGPAMALLDRLYAAAAAQNRAGSLIETGALRALALAASGEEAAAVAALAAALTLACPQGYVRVFADEGAPMAALLARLIAAQRSGGAAAEVPLGCLARLQRALGAQDVVPGAGRGSVTAAPGLVDPLTGRELEVLTMLAAGRSNQAIAGELVVTLDTVKKHVSHVLGKLGAANRTEAVTRARELSLIP